ncbi:hypothetical protein F511_35679 [Dorcoceras hygrometricum]|uniref:Uncharacterized protein n=1 Tax=Dorcoceras hygrometricum TaxID=472368 RepID=A0A2Z7C4P6_9LAMI|nr:hypothetical protein F511_35679 [Dorcoceras hygrometricum]
MVVDLIGIYGLKGPYCTLTMTDWFLQALSMIPRGSWGDVARRFTMIRWAVDRSDLIGDRSYDEVWVMEMNLITNAASLSRISRRRRRLPRAAAAAADRRRKLVSGQFDEENPFVLISSALLVQPDEGVSDLVVDRIGPGGGSGSQTDEPQQRHSVEIQPELDTPHTNAQTDLIGNPVVADLTNVDQYVAISETRFAGFNLPTDGLTDFSEVPNDLVLQERTLFSKSSDPVQFSCKKRLMKYEFRLLNDILAKYITVKVGSFDVVTHERFLMMTAIHFGIKVNWSHILFEVLKEMADRTTKRAKGFAAQICVLLKGDPAVTLGEAKTFPPLKTISAKTVNTYIATNKTIDARGESDEPEVAKVAIVKKKAVSKKRPAAVSEAIVVKKKRTTSEKAVSKEKDLSLVSVAQEAVPIQEATVQSVEGFCDGDNQQRASISRGNLELAIAKRCRSNKLVRQRFAFALRFNRWFLQRWIQQKLKDRRIQQKINPVEGYSALHIQSTKNSAEAQRS